MKKHNFSILELLMVISLIAILITVVIRNFSDVANSAELTTCKKNIKEIVQQISAYQIEKGHFPAGNRGNIKFARINNEYVNLGRLHEYDPNFTGKELYCPSSNKKVYFNGTDSFQPNTTNNPSKILIDYVYRVYPNFDLNGLSIQDITDSGNTLKPFKGVPTNKTVLISDMFVGGDKYYHDNIYNLGFADGSTGYHIDTIYDINNSSQLNNTTKLNLQEKRFRIFEQYCEY